MFKTPVIGSAVTQAIGKLCSLPQMAAFTAAQSSGPPGLLAYLAVALHSCGCT